MTEVNQIPRRNFDKMEPDFNQHYQQVVDTLNTLLGYYGETPLKSSLNLNGNRITGVAQPASATDVVTLEHANQTFSATALRPQLEANGSSPLQSMRRLNDATQREQNSSFLNTLHSTPPSANNIQVLFSTPGAGMTTITIPASLFQFADGSKIRLNAFTITVSNPAVFNIVAAPTGAVSNGTSANILTTAPTGALVGGYVTIAGVTDPNFNGTWQVSGIAGTSLTFLTSIPASNSGGGTVTTAGVYYFYAISGNPNPRVIGVAASADTPYNRLPTSLDGSQLIAVAAVDHGGGVTAQSAGGGTPGSTLNAGSFF